MLTTIASATDIELYQGDSLTVEFTIYWETGLAVDLTGYNIRMSVTGTDISKDSIDPAEIVKVAPYSGGVCQVFLLPGDTNPLTANYEYKYYAEIYDGSGNVYTFASGKFKAIT